MVWTSDMAADAAADVVSFCRSVTYREVEAAAFSTSSGARSEVTTDTAISMICGGISVMVDGNSRRRIETRRFSATQAALTAAALNSPDTSDRIVDGTDVWRIERIETKMDGAMIEFYCTRTA